MKNRLPISLTLFFLLTIALSAQPLVHVRTAHVGPITDLVFGTDPSTVYSGGNDGKVIIWDSDSERLVQSIHAAILPVRKIVPYPDGERVAVYASDGRNHRISLWNWKTGEREFLHIPTDEVLHLDVSSQGSYLVYSTPNFRSIRVLDGNSGRELPFLRQTTGIVTWFVIARSEERIMTYAPSSGDIVYRTVVTGREAGRFSGPTGLSNLHLLNVTRYAVAESDDGRLIVLDLLSGETASDVVAGEIREIHVDRADGDVVVVSRDYGGARSVRRFRFSDPTTTDGGSAGELQRRYTTRRTIPEEAHPFLFAARDMFAGAADGSLLRWLPFELRPQTMAANRVEPVADLAVADSTLHVLAADQIISITSDFFDSEQDPGETEYARYRTTGLEATSSGRFLPDDRGVDLLWTPGADRDNAIRRFDFRRSIVSPSEVVPPESLQTIDVYDQRVLFLDRSGRIELHDTRTGAELFSYRGRGLQTGILTVRGMFVGKAEDGIFDSSVLRVDTDTGETVALDTTTDLVFRLTYDARRGRLFSIGIKRPPEGGISTVIEIFEGAAFQRSRVILEIPGEYLDATVIVDPVTGTAYTTLDDRGGILTWDGTRVSELRRNPAHIPARIFQDGSYLYSVNRDGTVSVIARSTGEQVLDLYIIDSVGSGGWLAVRPES
jgi:hypothetical protein